MARELLMKFSVETNEDFVDINPNAIISAILDKAKMFANNNDLIYEQIHDLGDRLTFSPSDVKTSSRSSFLPVPGQEVHMWTFSSGKTKEEKIPRPIPQKKIDAMTPKESKLTCEYMVKISITDGWLTTKEIVSKISVAYGRKVSHNTVRRILSDNSDSIEKRRRKDRTGLTEYRMMMQGEVEL